MQDLKEIISKYNALVEDINYYIDNRHKIGALSNHFHVRLFLNYIDLITSLIEVKISPKEKNRLKKRIEKLYPVIKEIHKKVEIKKVAYDPYFYEIENLLKELELKKYEKIKIKEKIPSKHFEKIEEKKKITKTALIFWLKPEIFNRAILGIENTGKSLLFWCAKKLLFFEHFLTKVRSIKPRQSSIIKEKKYGEIKKPKIKNIFLILSILLIISIGLIIGFMYIKDKPPYYSTIPDINIFEDTNYELNLNNYFKDMDNKNLKFSSTKLNNTNISISKEGTVKIIPKKDWHGSESVSFTATDFWGKKNSSNFIKINVINTADCGMDGCEAGEDCINCPADCGICDIEKRKKEEEKYKQAEFLKKGAYEDVTKSYILFGISPMPRGYGIGRIGQTALSVELININPIPCIRFDKEERQLIFKEINMLDIKIPRGYEKIIPAFEIEKCDNIALDYTIVIPKIYADIKILRCIKNNCTESFVKETEKLSCSKTTIVRNETYIEPSYFIIPVEDKEIEINQINNVLISGDYKIKFYGDYSNRLSAEIKKPSEKIKLPANQNLMIVGTPLTIKFDKNLNISAEITMPYIANEDIDENSIGLYIKNKNEWKYIGGKLDKKSKSVTAYIKNLMYYSDSNNELQIALMGLICRDCSRITFQRVYNPEIETKEAVIFVHGLMSSPETFQELIDDIKLTTQPWQVWVFGYPSTMNIDEIAVHFSDSIQVNLEEYDSITIVAHSLGGLIAQKALEYGYKENLGTLRYSYIDKVRKLILIGSPNKGTPIVDMLYNVFDYLLNKETTHSIFDLNSDLLKNLSAGLKIPKIEKIDYYIVAGTKPYIFNILFFRENNTIIANDGLISTINARTIDDRDINKKCIDYFEINLTHTDLIDMPAGRKTIEKIIAKEVIDAFEEIPVIGNNKYYDARIENCSSKDRFIVIGKKIKKEEIYDETGCLCGNNVCGENENPIKCPEDCVIYKKHKWLLITMSVLILIVIFVLVIYRSKLKIKKPELRIKEKWKSLITNFKSAIKNIFEKIKQKRKKKKIKKIKRKEEIKKSEEKKEEVKEKKEELKLEEFREILSKIETEIDKLYYLIEVKEKIKLKDAAKILGITFEKVNEWAKVLEDHSLLKIHYPLFGGPILIKMKEEEREKLKKKKEE